MKIKNGSIVDFQQAFRADYKVTLPKEEVQEALENLVRFFNLLAQFDQEDWQRKKENKQNQKIQ